MFKLETCVAYMASHSTKFLIDVFDHMLNCKGITRVQWIALYYLGTQKQINQKELAAKMHIKESTVARLIDRMEKEDLVIRKKCEEDRRCFKLILTEKGIQYRERLLPEGEKFNQIASKDISEEEMQTLMSVLEKMTNNVEEHILKHK